MAGWQPTRALRRAVGLVCLALIPAVVLGRTDLVVLVVPLLTGTLWALRRIPEVPPEAAVAATHTQVGEGQEFDATVSVANPSRVRLMSVSVDLRSAGWLATTDESRPIVTVLPPRRAIDVAVRFRARRWGRHRLARVAIEVAACDGLLVNRPRLPHPVEVRVHPINEYF
ncbi:MAG TPA: DUF58 domain-containing protein, partial [Micromonosporaceae bacterium]|nr:DUF58 domain-containing protein [Micromonosporaceae bacterium]